MSAPRLPAPLRPLQYDFATSVAQALWSKAKDMTEHADAAMPIGAVMFMIATQPNLPNLPNPAYWQLCDGSVVTNTLSPMHGQTLPDLRNIFIKHPKLGDAALISSGGDNTRSFNHNHTATTSPDTDRDVNTGVKHGEDVATGGIHNHIILPDLPLIYDITPQAQQVQIYVRIV